LIRVEASSNLSCDCEDNVEVVGEEVEEEEADAAVEDEDLLAYNGTHSARIKMRGNNFCDVSVFVDMIAVVVS
jgi:hypothetical protein